MATAQMQATLQDELSALADYGATLTELLEHLGEQDGTLGTRLSGDQEEELQLYCWALHYCKSHGFEFGADRIPKGLEDDIGA
jgi:hypothetical protein